MRCSANFSDASRWARKRSASFSGETVGVVGRGGGALAAGRGAMGAGFTAGATFNSTFGGSARGTSARGAVDAGLRGAIGAGVTLR